MYDILIEFCIPMKLGTFIKMCLNGTCSGVQVGKHLLDWLPIKSSLTQGGTLLPLVFSFALEFATRRVEAHQEDLKLMLHINI
jgi:hypothetical protein